MLALLAALMFQPIPADTFYLVEIADTVFAEMVNTLEAAFPKEGGVCLYGTQAYVLREGQVVDLTVVTKVVPLRTKDATPNTLTPSNGCDETPGFLGVTHSHPEVNDPAPYACSLSGPDLLMALRKDYAIAMVVCSTGWGHIFWNKQPYPVSWFPWSKS
jgi:hypothetical protein